jgi:hypothetical protein
MRKAQLESMREELKAVQIAVSHEMQVVSHMSFLRSPSSPHLILDHIAGIAIVSHHRNDSSIIIITWSSILLLLLIIIIS